MQLTMTYNAERPLNADRIITLNCGLGRDSLTLLVLCFEGKLFVKSLGTVRPQDLDAVVFSNTGREWDHTYSVIPRVRELCARFGVRFVVLEKGDTDAGEVATSWDDIERKARGGSYHRRPDIMSDFQSRATVASLGKGDCTDNHKIQPIRRFISDLSMVRFGINNRSYSAHVRRGDRQPHVTIIGYAADEVARLENGEGRGPTYVTEAFPLIELGITKAGEDPILARWGLDDVRKSGCYMCPYQPASWFWALSETDPEAYAAVVRYEEIALARNPKMGATGFKSKGQIMRIPEVVTKWRAQNPDATIRAVLAKEYTRCTKDAKAQQRLNTLITGPTEPGPMTYSDHHPSSASSTHGSR